MCLDASGNEMEIIGKIHLHTSINGAQGEFIHDFRVLNSESCNSIILGRDFFKFYDAIMFDFKNDRIKVGNAWLKRISIQKKQ